jgi:hypothetical protein
MTRVVLDEDFNKNNIGWYNDESKDYVFRVANGKYRIESKTGGSWITSLPFRINTDADFEIATTITKLGGTDGYYFGLMLGFNPKSEYYHLAGITGWGNYVFADKGKTPVDLIPTKDNETVKKGNNTNTIQLLKQKNIIKLFINGQLMGEAIFSGFYGENFGFRIWSGSESLVLDVDKFTIKEFN